ncbi:MAG: sulfate adenylyltransferase, partial [Gemmatimonadetes bacterium]|nr:sulfate adenylyltransferase [Gemmatimonadota bacterium]
MIPPHGGTLVSLLVSPERAVELRRDSIDLPSWHLTPRQLCDFELLANGGFSPLTGFLTRSDYGSVLRAMRLGDGPLWPIPVTLGVSKEVAAAAERAGRLILRDAEGAILGLVHVEDVWEPDREAEAALVYSADPASDRAPLAAHPGVEALLQEPGDFYVGGRVEAAALPEHFDFREQRHTPAELRAEFARRGWNRVVAFQTRNPMHRAHYELTRRALESAWESGERGAGNGERAAALLIHPAVGPTKVGDVDHHTRVRCYRALLPRYPQGRVMLSLLPLAMRLAGPREALWHAIIRQNYGCSHFIVGRDHAGPGGVYEPFAAQQTVGRYAADLAIQVLPFDELVYEPGRGGYVPASEASRRALRLSGTELRRRLAEGGEIPEWFTFPEVAAELRRRYDGPPQPGLTVFLTGLPGSGKSTLAKALAARLV